MSTVIKNVIFKDISEFIHIENGFLPSELSECQDKAKSQISLKSLFSFTGITRFLSDEQVCNEEEANDIQSSESINKDSFTEVFIPGKLLIEASVLLSCNIEVLSFLILLLLSSFSPSTSIFLSPYLNPNSIN